jgi:DNA gyrase inhibitor GyrI
MSHDDVTITKVPPMPVDAMRNRGPMQSAYRQGTIIDKPVHELTFWEKVRLVPFLVQTIYGVIMKNPKTTITGIVGAAAYVINTFVGVVIPQEAIVAVTLFILGLFSQDGEA